MPDPANFFVYEILDAATQGPELCPCGRGLPLLTRVDGKVRPMFWLPDGQRKNSSPLVNAIGKLKGMRQRQIVQTDLDAVTVCIVPGPGWTAEDSSQIQQLVTDFFERPLTVDVQLFEQLERPGRRQVVGSDQRSGVPQCHWTAIARRRAMKIWGGTNASHVPHDRYNRRDCATWKLDSSIPAFVSRTVCRVCGCVA